MPAELCVASRITVGRDRDVRHASLNQPATAGGGLEVECEGNRVTRGSLLVSDSTVGNLRPQAETVVTCMPISGRGTFVHRQKQTDPLIPS